MNCDDAWMAEDTTCASPADVDMCGRWDLCGTEMGSDTLSVGRRRGEWERGSGSRRVCSCGLTTRAAAHYQPGKLCAIRKLTSTRGSCAGNRRSRLGCHYVGRKW